LPYQNNSLVDFQQDAGVPPSLEPGTPNAHNVSGWHGVVPCGGWLREVCGHGAVRWIPLRCHKWQCDTCGPGKHMEFLERLQGALTLSKEKGWTWRGGRTGFFWKGSWTLKFVTLTYAEDVTKKQVRLSLAHLVQGIRRKYGYCEYAKVPEFTKNGRIHLHLAMIMPYIRQKELSAMWKSYAKAPNVWITAVIDSRRLKVELAKYLSKAPAGKVTYSRNFPKPEPIQVKSGPCEACDGREHRFEFMPEWLAVQEYPMEETGRCMAGEPIYVVPCQCWPVGHQ